MRFHPLAYYISVPVLICCGASFAIVAPDVQTAYVSAQFALSGGADVTFDHGKKTGTTTASGTAFLKGGPIHAFDFGFTLTTPQPGDRLLSWGGGTSQAWTQGVFRDSIGLASKPTYNTMTHQLSYSGATGGGDFKFGSTHAGGVTVITGHTCAVADLLGSSLPTTNAHNCGTNMTTDPASQSCILTLTPGSNSFILWRDNTGTNTEEPSVRSCYNV